MDNYLEAIGSSAAPSVSDLSQPCCRTCRRQDRDFEATLWNPRSTNDQHDAQHKHAKSLGILVCALYLFGRAQCQSDVPMALNARVKQLVEVCSAGSCANCCSQADNGSSCPGNSRAPRAQARSLARSHERAHSLTHSLTHPLTHVALWASAQG